MEHWNNIASDKETMDTNFEEPEKSSIPFVDFLDMLIKEHGVWQNDWDSSQHAEERRKIKKQIERRLALIFPDFNGLDIGRKWNHSVFHLDERDLLYERDGTIYPKEKIGMRREFEHQIRALREQFKTEVLRVIILFCYTVYLYGDNCPFLPEKKECIIQNTIIFFSKINQQKPGDRARSIYIESEWKYYWKSPVIQKMSRKIQENCDIYDLFQTVCTATGISPEDIMRIMRTHHELLALKDSAQLFIVEWKKYYIIQGDISYKEFRDAWVFESDPSVTSISSYEAEFLRLLFTIIPYNNQSVMKALQRGKWYVIPAELRKNFCECLAILSLNENLVNRYIGAIDRFSCENQVECVMAIEEITKNSYVENKLTILENILRQNKMPDKYLDLIEKTIDKILDGTSVFCSQMGNNKGNKKYWYLEPEQGNLYCFESWSDPSNDDMCEKLLFESIFCKEQEGKEFINSSKK